MEIGAPEASSHYSSLLCCAVCLVCACFTYEVLIVCIASNRCFLQPFRPIQQNSCCLLCCESCWHQATHARRGCKHVSCPMRGRVLYWMQADMQPCQAEQPCCHSSRQAQASPSQEPHPHSVLFLTFCRSQHMCAGAKVLMLSIALQQGEEQCAALTLPAVFLCRQLGMLAPRDSCLKCFSAPRPPHS